jgi:prevent-host-death family protein
MDVREEGRKPLGLAEIGAEEARVCFGELLDRAGFKGERIIVTRHGKPLVALVSIEDARLLVEGRVAEAAA